jgi:hypothetical protein
MSFDAIDRRFRRPEPIRLECTECGGTNGTATRVDLPDEPVLCDQCAYHARINSMWAGL